jgi:hypothetical protein
VPTIKIRFPDGSYRGIPIASGNEDRELDSFLHATGQYSAAPGWVRDPSAKEPTFIRLDSILLVWLER